VVQNSFYFLGSLPPPPTSREYTQMYKCEYECMSVGVSARVSVRMSVGVSGRVSVRMSVGVSARASVRMSI